MHPALKQLEAYLTSEYSTLSGEDKWHFGNASEYMQKPCLVWNSSTLGSHSDEDNATGCGVFDPAIGLCLYFQVYDPKQPIREHVQQALTLRSKLQWKSNADPSQVDRRGAWRVAIHWLVSQSDFKSWVQEAADLRERTSHFEEIPADAIVDSTDDWSTAISAHGVPRLLFRLRGIMKRKTKDEIDQWQNADTLVMGALRNLPDDFTDGLAKQCAQEVVNSAVSTEIIVESKFDGIAKQLSSIAIRNFRNIDELDLTFRDGSSTVASTVIQGPNGSGKSSVFEALSLAVSGVSSRYYAYFTDKHRRRFSNRDEYEAQYLRNLSNGSQTPSLRLNGGELEGIKFSAPDEISLHLQELRGTFLSQDSGQAFISMSADELGGEIASSLSHLANTVRTFTEGRVASANQQLKDFNARWNLRGNVVRRETVATQIAEMVLRQSLPSVSEIQAWLADDTRTRLPFAEQADNIRARINTWQHGTSDLIRRFASGAESEVVQRVQTYYSDLMAIIEAISSLSEHLTVLTADWDRQDVERLRRQGEWLERTATADDLDSPVIRDLKDNEKRISDELNSIVRHGTEISNRLGHLDGIRSYVSMWAEHHPDSCPTCDTYLSEGVKGTIDALRASLETDRTASRNLYQAKKKELDSVQFALAERGVAAPPFTPDEVARLERCYSWLCSKDRTLADTLGDGRSRQVLVATIQYVNNFPRAPVINGDVYDLSVKLVGQVFTALGEHEKVLRLPAAWKEVEKVVTSRLATVTAEHLPQTIQAVWQEVARNIMPARWQQPGDIEFSAAAAGRSTVASIMVHGIDRTVLASHILNGAEVHNLGLAWFITKYFLFGRFRYQFLVLDDPSDAMDQATFRDLCRFLETVMRLHVVEGMELSLVMLMHQDQRALDAARALNAVLYLLRWNKHTKSVNRPMRIFGENMAAPVPLLALG